MAVGRLDLDDLKRVNVQRGRRTIDTLLCGFAQTVRGQLCGSDVLGRIVGEEFGLGLSDTDLASARWLVEQMRRAVEAMDVPSNPAEPVRVTVPTGLAVADPKGLVSDDRRYGHAHQAPYPAKHGGRGQGEAVGLGTGASAPLPSDEWGWGVNA